MNYVTIAQLLEVGEGTVLALHTHVLACETWQADSEAEQASSSMEDTFWHGRPKPNYSWFNDKCNQELLVCVHEVLCCKALENLVAHSYQPKSTSAVPAYAFRRSEELRMLFAFKKYDFRQHIVIPDQATELTTLSSLRVSAEQRGWLSVRVHSLTPRASFFSEHGKRVLPYLGVATYGSGYRSYRVLPEALHAFVDHFEVTSSKGIFKVLSAINPKHRLSPDIISYFKNDDDEESHETEEGLAQVPLRGLRHKPQRGGGGGGKSGRGRYGRPLRGGHGKGRSEHSAGQSNILEVFAKYKRSHKKEENVEEMTAKNVFGDIPAVVIDEFFEFDPSQRDDNPVPEDDPVTNEDNQLLEDDPDTNEDNELLGDDPVVNEDNKLFQMSQLLEDDPLFSSDNEDLEKDVLAKKQRLDSPPPETVLDTSRKGEDQYLFDITDDDIDMALFDIKTPVLLSQQESSSQSHSQSHSRPLITKSKSLPPPTSLDPNDSPNKWTRKSKSDSILCSPAPTKDPLDEVTNILQSPPLSAFDELLQSAQSVGDHGESSAASLGPMIDLTGEEDYEAISDVDASQSSQQEEENGSTMKTKSKKPLPSLEKIIKGARNVRDLSQKQVGLWIRLRKPVLLEIFKRNTFSRRHEDYIANPKKRAALVYQVDTRMFRKNQVDLVNKSLLKIFCSRDGKFFSYVMSVLQPECLIRLIADVHKVDFNEAELMMFNYRHEPESIDLTDSLLDDD